jgi:hypothetical protein
VPEGLAAAIQEVRDLETAIRDSQKTATQWATLSTALLALTATYLSSRVGVAAVCALPVFLTVVALGHLNSATEAAHLAEIRDYLSDRVNNALGQPILLVGRLDTDRRLSPTGISVNVIALAILLVSFVAGLILAWPEPWRWWQVGGTGVLIALGTWSLWDFFTVRRRTSAALKTQPHSGLEMSRSHAATQPTYDVLDVNGAGATPARVRQERESTDT